MQEFKQYFYWENRKVNKGLSLLGGLTGLCIATPVLSFFAISGEDNLGWIIFALLPLAGVVLFSLFDKGALSSSSVNYGSPNQVERKSKFNKPSPSLDLFGLILGTAFSYLSIYLSVVCALVYTYYQEYSVDNVLDLFVDIFVNILDVDWTSQYVWYYWISLTVFLAVAIAGGGLFSYLHMKKNIKPGRKLTEAEKAKLAYGAVLFTRNGLSYDYLLAYLPSGRITVKNARELLARDWNIHDKNGVLHTVRELLSKDSISGIDKILVNIRSGTANTDEQIIYDDITKNLIAHYQYSDEEIGKIQTLSAWNDDRLVNLVRYAYVAKYISEQEMWYAIDQIIVHAKRYYRTWREYFAAILLGQSLGWGGNYESNRIVAMKLLNNKNSIYKQYPF